MVSLRAKTRLAGLGIALATAAAYANSFAGRFFWDDFDAIVKNPTIRHLGALRALVSPPPGTTVHGRPLLNLSFALNYAIGGANPWSYHAVNLAIHILAGLALFGILRRTLARVGGRWQSDALPLAFLIALLWALHPLQTEAVTYIVQRAESLMGLFYLLTLYCFVRGARLCPLDAGSAAAVSDFADREGRKPEVEPNLWYGLSWLACLLGMGTKEVMATVPVVVFFYDRTFLAGSFAEAWRKRASFYCWLAATWLALAPIVLALGRRDATSGVGSGVGWGAYVLTQFPAIARYLRLAFWPSPLAFYYEPAWVPGLQAVWPYALAVAALAAAALLALLYRPKLGFLGFWFFAILAPTSLMPGATETMAERRMYLPLAALLTAVVLALHARLGRRVFPLLLALALALGWATFRRNRVYASDLALWSDTVAKRPDNAAAHYNLGVALSASPGRSPLEAAKEYAAAARLDPGYSRAHNNLGAVLADLPGGLPRAIAEFRAAVQLDPDYAEAHDNLGEAWLRTGHRAEAIAEFRAALQSDPGYAAAHYNLGNALSDLPGRLSDAAAEYAAALRIRPDYPEAQNNLGIVLLHLPGRSSEAIAHFQAALRDRPDDAEFRTNLGNAYLSSPGKEGEAVGAYEEALRLAPGYVPARFNLGLALLKEGRKEEAAEQFEAVLRLSPGNPSAERMLAGLRPAAK